MAESRAHDGQTSATGALDALVGTWRGQGAGDYPTMEPFEYEEEIVFSRLTERAVRYAQHAWSPADGETMHIEGGIWRATPDGRLEVTVALPGVAEVSEGSAVDGAVRLESTSMSRATRGAGLVASVRSYDVDGDRLSYDIHMATVEVPVERHIWGTLTRADRR